MRHRIWWAWLLGVTLSGCGSVWTPVLPPAPPPVVQPPVDPPPPVTPPDAPVPVTELVARLAAGSTVAEAEQVFGRPADNVAPASGPAPEVRRWYVVAPDGKWAIHVVMRGGKVVSAGSSKVREVP